MWSDLCRGKRKAAMAHGVLGGVKNSTCEGKHESNKMVLSSRPKKFLTPTLI
jgi:hypothetical protein